MAVPRLPTVLRCVACGSEVPVIGQWDEAGRPWARVPAPVWISVDSTGHAVVRCIACEPRGRPIVVGRRARRPS